jgi:hypothetical protein
VVETAASRRVSGSIPSVVTGDFFPSLPKEPCALGSTEPLNMSEYTRILLRVKTAGA